jgi:DNA modification methylase
MKRLVITCFLTTTLSVAIGSYIFSSYKKSIENIINASLITEKAYVLLYGSYNSKEKVKHSSQKPIALMERCVLLCSKENDTILDPFMGSGSTGVACKNLNRTFIGIEANKEHFELAKHRIN